MKQYSGCQRGSQDGCFGRLREGTPERDPVAPPSDRGRRHRSTSRSDRTPPPPLTGEEQKITLLQDSVGADSAQDLAA